MMVCSSVHAFQKLPTCYCTSLKKAMKTIFHPVGEPERLCSSRDRTPPSRRGSFCAMYDVFSLSEVDIHVAGVLNYLAERENLNKTLTKKYL